MAAAADAEDQGAGAALALAEAEDVASAAVAVAALAVVVAAVALVVAADPESAANRITPRTWYNQFSSETRLRAGPSHLNPDRYPAPRPVVRHR
jgi:hypothetical protein